MIKIYAKQSKVIDLGYVGEHEARQIVFDIEQYLSEFENATVVVMFKPADSILPYSIELSLNREKTEAYWLITSHETFICGDGICQLNIIENNIICKTITFKTFVNKSVDDLSSIGDLANTIYPNTNPDICFYTNLDLDILGENYKADITFVQDNKIVFVKHTEDITIVKEDRLITCKLTKEDTSELVSCKPLVMQIRLVTEEGKILPSELIKGTVGIILNTGEVE